MESIWQVGFGVAGVAGVAAFVMWSVYKQWLKLPIFQTMTKDQQFRLFRLVIWLTFLLAIFSLVAFVSIRFGSASNSERTSTGGVSFSQVEMVDTDCFWEPIRKPYRVVAPLRGPDGNYWRMGGPPKGIPRSEWPMGSHHLWPLPKDGVSVAAEKRTEDPMFSITLLNTGSDAAIVSRLGIRPVAAWTSPKGPPFAGRLTEFDGYTLTVIGFEPNTDQWLPLREPVYMAPQGAYRYRLLLDGYCAQVKHNESAVKLIAEINHQVVESPAIYLGLYGVRS